MRRGAISFEDREAKVLVDENGHPKDILLRTRVGERLLNPLCWQNETVARHYHDLKLPFISDS